VIRPAVDALVAKVPSGQRDEARLLAANLPDDALAMDVIKAAYGVTVTSDEVFQRLQAQQASVAAGHNGGVKTARKRRMGVLPTVDRAGKTWKPTKTGPLDTAIFPKWSRVPMYIPPLVEFMSRVELATVVIVGEEVDRKGRFKLPRADHARRAGCSEGKAYAALVTFKNAGLIEVDIPGDREQATVWRYRPVVAVNIQAAARVLQGARKRANQAIEKAKAAGILSRTGTA
jgi:hypothetical protein